MDLSFKLESFEGPLDLLLHLIEKNKVDIYDIPIAMITDQYLEYVRAMKDKDADRMSEFLVMAATLLDIKARMLIPKDEEETEEEEDPRAELVRKLLEYKMYKYMSYELKDKEVAASHALYKTADIPDEVKKYEAPVDLDVMLAGTDMKRLQEVFDDVIKRSIERINLNALRMQSIKREQVNIADRVSSIREHLSSNAEFSFRKLIEKQETKINVIVTFLAILELMKAGELRAQMTSDNKDIIITRKSEDDNYNEEFDIPEDIRKKELRRQARQARKEELQKEAELKKEAELQSISGLQETDEPGNEAGVQNGQEVLNAEEHPSEAGGKISGDR